MSIRTWLCGMYHDFFGCVYLHLWIEIDIYCCLNTKINSFTFTRIKMIIDWLCDIIVEYNEWRLCLKFSRSQNTNKIQFYICFKRFAAVCVCRYIAHFKRDIDLLNRSFKGLKFIINCYVLHVLVHFCCVVFHKPDFNSWNSVCFCVGFGFCFTFHFVILFFFTHHDQYIHH